MDEFENDALSLILMLDDNLFPQFLEWAGSQGWADLVIFLLETDFLRFRSDDAFQKDNLNVQSSLISRLADFTMERTGVLGSFHKILSDEQIESLKRLGDSHIPLNSVFSHVCDYVWQDVISRGRAITTSSMWPSLRKFIVSDVKMSVGKVLGDLTNRKFFERFLQEDPADLSCLQCWISVRRIFNAVEKYTKIKNTTHNDLDSDTVSVVSVDTTSATDRDNGGFMKRWRSSSHAVKGANKALQTGSGTATTNANSNQVELGPREYSDPFEVFKIFLEGARSLQKQFFPSNAPTPSSTAQTYTRYKSNYSVQKGDEVNLEDLLTEFNQSVDPNAHRKSSTSLHHSPGIASYGGSRNVTQNHQCAGLSESLRMELVATLSLNGSVRTQDIEIVDQAFAFACANIFDKLLRKLEKETYQYILSIYPRFEQSIDYTLMIASIKSESCFSIMQYSTKLNFLYNRVRRESFVTWTDPSSKGKYFLVYEKSIEDYDDEEDPEEDDFYLCYNDYDHFTYFNPSGSVDGAGYGDEYGGAITTWNDRGGSFSGNLDRMISPPNPHEANRGSSMERANTFSNEMKMSTNPLRHQRSNSLGNANASTKVNFVEPVPRANSMMDNRINVVVAEPVQDIKVASTQVIVAISIELGK